MNFRRHLLETVTLVVVAVAIALVSNAIASRERKLKLPGDYPNATAVPTRAAAQVPSAPPKAAPVESSSAAAQRGSGSLASTGEHSLSSIPAERRGVAGAPPESSRSGKTLGGVSTASPATAPAPAAPAEGLLSRFPPHPDRPYVEISGEDAARLWAAGVLFLDARRTSAYEEGHVAGARPFSAWESDVDQKVMVLLAERDGGLPLVIYCSGGDCEDSHLLAQKLWGAGFNDILVYRDGYPDWVKRGGAVRTGAAP
jgi:rhodanese-related sulfurtransferase